MSSPIMAPEQRFHPIFAEGKKTRLSIEGRLKAPNDFSDPSFPKVSADQFKGVIQVGESRDFQASERDVTDGVICTRQVIKATNGAVARWAARNCTSHIGAISRTDPRLSVVLKYDRIHRS